MSVGAQICLGIALDGIVDGIATCAAGPIPRPQPQPTVQPGCVIEPSLPGERPLAGEAAFASLDGRDWDAAHARVRRPILPLLRGLEGRSDAPGSPAPSAVSDLLTAHIRALTNQAPGRCVIAVPDTLTELGQQRLLDGLRRANIPAELLWRPIATLLGWACQQPVEQLQALDGRSVLVVHAGFWVPEVTVINLEVEEHQGRPWLMPIRAGRGLGLTDPQAWPIESAAQAIMDADLARITLPPASLDKTVLWLFRRPWAVLCGDSLPTEVLRDSLEHWHQLLGTLYLPTDQAKPLLVAPLQDLLRQEAKRETPVDRVLIEGPLVRLNLGEASLGDWLAGQLVQWLGQSRATAEVLRPDALTTACGAAHYAWRCRQGIPGYYDTVPDLQINACVEGQAQFVSLAEGQARVVGGKAIGPREVTGFSVAAGTLALDYYLARADESTVRLTHTELPEKQQNQIPINLVVTQTPGQGFASVEVRPTDRDCWSGRPVFLNWNLMDDTQQTKDEVLESLAGQCRLAYPKIEPVHCHAAVWKAYDVPRVMTAFLDCVRTISTNDDSAPLRALRTVLDKQPTSQSLRFRLHNRFPHTWLKEQLPDERKKYSVVNSDGEPPLEADLVAFLGPAPQTFETYRLLYKEVVRATDAAFSVIANTAEAEGDRHRQLLLIGGWLYSAVPLAIVQRVRQVLSQPTVQNTLWTKCVFNVAGRSLTAPGDIRLLFAKVLDDFNIGGRSRPYYRMEAVRRVLTYREDAPLALTHHLAAALARDAAFVMDNEQQVLANKFFVAARLLMGLLRYRRVEAGFLSPTANDDEDLLFRINMILASPSAATPARRAQLERVFGLMYDFMEARGSPIPIFEILEEIEQ